MEYRDLEKYDYRLPKELIRKCGVEPRDSARLFVYDTGTDTVFHDTFANLASYLPERAMLVLNETRVVPARLMLSKETGGKIEAFVLANEIRDARPEAGEMPRSDESSGSDVSDPLIPILVDRKCVPGMKLFFPDGSRFEVVSQDENRFFVRLHSGKSLSDLLDAYGETPIPHYLEDAGATRDEQALRRRYQTVFARSGASVAAPTASLHFTDQVLGSLAGKGIETVRVGLDVGLGTFASLRPENFVSKTLHREHIRVSEAAAERLTRAKAEGRGMVAVGTTALRTLETVIVPGADTGMTEFRPYSGDTDIFIFPPHGFRSADMLLTNFHLPKSSLMLLVEAFLRDKGAKRTLVSLYEEAIREGYAFYSFGDSMLIR
ncbi:MAG: tRNA preQ1(34) S-adenosylmethionine ribosyltransferase-isomerase QueA [Candidatus Moranbacteria bacterium]|nr:tRNA preQ1(34) S-adenosylmethionine ribosyltransferase-isomerase QueA [Candidatus Moranbacteria bacterium]NTW89300.1 tRNA preQ1(34) S-adenosylmethionine ribosyltransferase-isomerase QueA [Candidatus Moranbacteria bacterium]